MTSPCVTWDSSRALLRCLGWRPRCTCAEDEGMADQRRFVIVGGGLAGAKGAEALRERGFQGSIVLFGSEEHLPYERPPLSKGYLKTGEGLDEAYVHDAQWYAAHDVEVRTGTTVVAVDRDAREVVTAGGERT